jgi:hypothetical protein
MAITLIIFIGATVIGAAIADTDVRYKSILGDINNLTT